MAANSVIRTRLYPPVSRAPLIERARLLELLERDTGRHLTVVAAPAGFGKTTILGQWFERLRGEGLRCCWCSLDREDNQPTRFLRHVVSALRTVGDLGSDVIRQLDTTLIADIAATLPTLLNEIADFGHGTVLFIDDYHHVRSDEINHYVELLVTLAPPNLRIVIASRLRPHLSLSSLRMRGELCEITANHLRFDIAETKAFVQRTIRLDLSGPQLDRLYEHSEGWAAGLQLASLSMRDATRRDAFIASFSGSLRDIADYLTTDVLSQQPAELRDFLLRTAVLDRLNAGVAAAVTRNPQARTLLDTVEANNLFLVPLDDNREWYRYHHLFQDFLLAELRRTHPGETVALYQRASDWFADAGYSNEAVNYALLSGDLGRVGRLVHAGTLEHLAMDGKMTALLSWVSNIPGSIKAAFPRLLVQECIALSHLCRSAAAADVAEQARAAIARLPQASDYRYSTAELARLRLEASVLPCMVAFCKDDVDLVEAASLAEIDSTDDLVLAMANNFLGFAALQRHRLEEAEYHFGRGRFHHISKGTYYGAVFSDCFYAMSRLQQFRLEDAYEHAISAERLIDDIEGGHIPGLAKARVMQAVVLYEWNRLDEARDILDTELRKIETAGQVSIAQHGFLALARCRYAAGQPDEALKALDRCLQVSQHTNREYINLAVETERARLSALSGSGVGARSVDPGRLTAMFERLRSDWNRVTFARPFLQLQNCVYAGRLEVLDGPMQEFRALCRGRGLLFADLQLQLLSALGHQQRGEHRAALDLVRNAVTAACPENGLRRLLDVGPALQPLYAELQREEHASVDPIRREFLDRLLAARESARNGSFDQRRTAPATINGAAALVEELSGREIQVLEWMARGDSNAAIGTHLLISENTVKWHIKNVFAKLGVNNRTAAVMAARQRRLLA